jgi:formamidopyrimidine-DNA glycosylase
LPELPEVETITASLRAKIRGAIIERIVIGHPSFVRDAHGAAAHLAGSRIAEVLRQGKRITIRLDPPARVVCHLGMTGRIHVVSAESQSAPHTHLRIRLDDGARELRFCDARRFGGVWILGEKSETALATLGPDALDLELAELERILRRERQIKALLLDQRAISGLGNIYCDEALFAARIHPRTIAARISRARVGDLHRALRRILRDAIRHRGSTLRDYATVEGGSGRFQSKHLVYGRKGRPCTRCGAAIRRIQAAGRSSHVCPRCQRAPRAKTRRRREPV